MIYKNSGTDIEGKSENNPDADVTLVKSEPKVIRSE